MATWHAHRIVYRARVQPVAPRAPLYAMHFPPTPRPLCYSVSLEPCLQFGTSLQPALEFATCIAPPCEDC